MVIYAGGNSYTLTAYIASSSPSDRIGFKNDNAGFEAKCIIRGHDLVFSGGDGNDPFYIFDFDFDEQHKKAWELNDGQYLLQLPILLGILDKTYYAIINASSGNNSITLCVNSTDGSTGYQPVGADAELEDIDVAAWFVNMVGTTARDLITSIMENILDMEYGVRPGVYLDTFEPSIDGTFNPYTDGGDYTPLRIVSRFPNGSPVNVASQNELLCTFNRDFSLMEIGQKIKVVYGMALQYGLGTMNYVDQGGIQQLIFTSGPVSFSFIKGVSSDNQPSLLAFYQHSPFDIYNIDFDNQFRRSIPTGVTKMNVQIPQLLGNPSTSQGIAIVTDSESPDQLYVIANNDNKRPYICQGDTVLNQLGEWGNNLSFDNVSALLQAIVAMEFTGYDEIPINIQDSAYKESSASGYVVTPLIPQTLS